MKFPTTKNIEFPKFIRIVLLTLCCAAFAFSKPAIQKNGNGNTQQAQITSVELTIDGNTSESELISQLATQESPWSIWVFFNEQITEKLGAPRRFFNQSLFEQDILRLKEYLNEHGYFKVEIDTTVIFSTDQKNVDISIKVKENVRSLIDTLRIGGISNIYSDILDEIRSKSLLKIHEPYTREIIAIEQNRVIKLLQNSGYPTAIIDSVGILRYASSNNISIFIGYKPGQRYVFGNVELPEQKSDVEEEVLLRQLDFLTGDFYSEDKRIASEQNLNRLGLFENVSLHPTFVDDETTSVAPLKITLRTLDLQEITPEFLAVNENTALSAGIGLRYKHRNFFGGAKNLSINASGRLNDVQQIPDILLSNKKFNTLWNKLDIQSQLTFPYFYGNKTSASITLSAESDTQEKYELNTLRGKLGLITKLATYTVGFIDFNIERIDPKNPEIIKTDDSTKQFNIIEAFTLQRDKTNNIFSPNQGFFHSATIEEAGLISRSVKGLGLPYSEYLKLTFTIKHFFSNEFSQSHVWALKFKGGIAHLYNPSNTTPVPIPRRFFAGGSLSVRGWKDKTLSAFGDSLKGGNLLIEGSIESRLQLFPNGGMLFKFLELQRLWSVIFVDYGNTWIVAKDFDIKNVASAVGFGLRYETFIGPLRLDFAWRLYDPNEVSGQRWLVEQLFFNNSYSLVHFGIGQSF